MEDKHGEVTNQVVISVEDCKNVFEYCNHFGLTPPNSLKDALEDFISEQTFENQNMVKLELCKWVLYDEHPSFKDKLWEEPQKLATQAEFDLQFDKDLKEELSNRKEVETAEKVKHKDKL
jgi:hypothetical protein